MATSRRYAAHPSEKQFQAAVVAAAKVLGWRVYFTVRSKFSPSGYPDLTMVRGERILFAELKVKGRKPTPIQRDWLQALAGVPSAEVHVWTPDDWSEIDTALRNAPGAPLSRAPGSASYGVD